MSFPVPHRCLRGWILAAALVAAAGARAVPLCSSFTVTGVAFGAYNSISATPTDSIGTVNYFCPGALSPVITISAGSSGTFTPRQMLSGPDVLAYNLYTDAARTVIWGDGTGGSTTVIGTTSVKPVTNTIYGRIFPGQSVALGAYSDTLIVTINF